MRRTTEPTGRRWPGVAVLLVACGAAGHTVLLSPRDPAPAAIRDACRRAEVRCSSCHTIDRVSTADRHGHNDWTEEVQRMRLKPASGITAADAEAIVACLVYLDGHR